MKTTRLSLLILAAALTMAGCGRKNLPVAPSPVTAPIGTSQTPNSDNSPASTANFQRSARISAAGGVDTGGDLTITPAEVGTNPGTARKSFPLDGLLN